MKLFDLTVTVRIAVPDADPKDQQAEAQIVAEHFARMAMTYKSVGAVSIAVDQVKEAS